MSNTDNDNITTLKGFLRLPDVLKLFPVSKTVWWKGVKNKIFPQPINLTVRTVAWLVSDIEDLITRTANKQNN